MENYEKEPSHIGHEVEDNPFTDPSYFHMEVPKDRGAKTMANRVLKVLGPSKPIVIYATGRATGNAVSCAEIVKAYHKQIFQITRLGQVRTIETWSPVDREMELDEIKVKRAIPMIFILMSLEQLDEKQVGYQKSIGRRKDARVLTMSELSSSLSEELPIPQSPPSPHKERCPS